MSVMLQARFIVLIGIFLAFLTATPSCTSAKREKLLRATRLYDKGDRALRDKKYTVAVEAYDECLKTFPHEPTILSNKSAALRFRGVETYNKAIKNSDNELKVSGIEEAKLDIQSAAIASWEAVSVARSSATIEFSHYLSI